MPYVDSRLPLTPELDGIRGWACGSIVIIHCFTGIITPSPGSWHAPGSWHSWFHKFTASLFLSGVDLFFVLSGLLIGGILIDSRLKPDYFRDFWVRRIARILPVAYLVLASYSAALFITSYFHIVRFDGWLLAEYRPPIWTFATFTQSLPIAFGGMNGPRWMAMTWSLAIEEQFYLLFPLAVYWLRRKSLMLLVIAGILLAPIMRQLLLVAFGHWYPPYVLLPSRMDSIFFGVALALILRNGTASYLATKYRLFLDGLALIIYVGVSLEWSLFVWFPARYTALAVMWSIIILRVFTARGSLFNRVWVSPILLKLGLISYALYMYHQAVNGLVHGLMFNMEPKIESTSQLVAAIAVIGISVGLSALSYRYFEMPIRDFAAAWLSKRKMSAARKVEDCQNDLIGVQMQLNLRRVGGD